MRNLNEFLERMKELENFEMDSELKGLIMEYEYRQTKFNLNIDENEQD